MSIKKRALNLLIKPVSSTCNLRCRYCFYADVAANRHMKNYGLMSRETAETIIRRALEEAGQVTFGFQGGEPTLWGLNNFRYFVETVNRLNIEKAQVFYTLQTNGTLLDDEWARFLKENGFLTGLSLDGYKDLHDEKRMDAKGQGCYNKAMKAAAILQKHEAAFNILSVVTSESARHTEKLYRFFKKQGFGYLQFIPCIDDFGSPNTSLTDAQYAQFLKTLFDLWYQDCINGHGISVRYFDNLLCLYDGRPPEQCSMGGVCHVQFTVESDGSVYPCDFYVLDEWKLGGIYKDSFGIMLSSDTAKRFIAGSAGIRGECAGCKWLKLCRGGCKRDREPVINGIPSINRFCQAYKDFFSYSNSRFIELWTRFFR